MNVMDGVTGFLLWVVPQSLSQRAKGSSASPFTASVPGSSCAGEGTSSRDCWENAANQISSLLGISFELNINVLASFLLICLSSSIVFQQPLKVFCAFLFTHPIGSAYFTWLFILLLFLSPLLKSFYYCCRLFYSKVYSYVALFLFVFK